MTPYERMTARLAGESVDRPPNFDIFMTFAAYTVGNKVADIIIRIKGISVIITWRVYAGAHMHHIRPYTS